MVMAAALILRNPPLSAHEHTYFSLWKCMTVILSLPKNLTAVMQHIMHLSDPLI